MEQQNSDGAGVVDTTVQRRTQIEELSWAFPQDAGSPFDYRQASAIITERWCDRNSSGAMTRPIVQLWRLRQYEYPIAAVAKAQRQWIQATDHGGPIYIAAVLARPFVWLGVRDNGKQGADPFTSLNAAILARQVLDHAVVWNWSHKTGHRCVWAVLDISNAKL